MALTDTQAIQRLRDRLNESAAATWNDRQLYSWLDDGLRDVARRTLCLTDQRLINLIAQEGDYQLPSDIIRIFRCEYVPGNGRRTPLSPRAYNTMDQVWWSDQDTTFSDPIFYTSWGNPPAAKLKLYPAPASSIVNGLRLFVARLPAPVPGRFNGTGTGAPLDIPEGYEDMAIDYAEYLALRRDRQTSMMAEALAQYERKVNDITSNGLLDPGTGTLDVNNEMLFDGPWPLPRWLVDGSNY